MILALLIAALPAFTEGEVVVHDFHFRSGETLAELKLHYRTLGEPRSPAVLILHGTTGSGAQFLGPTFAGALFGPGQILDARRTFLVLPDGIGHGGSSKPSDGLRARFPHYDYEDMVEAQRLVLQHLGVGHLRLILGTSMGCMHAWIWLEKYPRFLDAALPLACLPVQIAGRNRIFRTMIMDRIRGDPAWRGGDYTDEPQQGLRAALDILFTMGSAPVWLQREAPTRDAADRLYEEWMRTRLPAAEANDMLYAFDASRDYDPSAGLGKIEAAVTAVNSADDTINPPELGILQQEVARVPRGKAVVLPISPLTRGHGTHTIAAAWSDLLVELLQRSQAR